MLPLDGAATASAQMRQGGGIPANKVNGRQRYGKAGDTPDQ